MKQNRRAAAALLAAALLNTGLPAICEEQAKQSPASPTASPLPRPCSPDDILIVQLADGADRQRFDDQLQEMHGRVIQTVQAGPNLDRKSVV